PHAAYGAVLAEDFVSERAGGIGTPEGPPLQAEGSSWLDRFEVEHDNLRAALDGRIENGEAAWGLRLGAALFHFWEEREHFTEGRERLARLLRLPGAEARTRARARVLFAAGVLAGDLESANAFHEEAREISREV